jgi:predicted nucleotidyltransferase
LAANSPTKFPEINKILELLLSSATRVLGSQLVGMYFYGSLPSGDFDLETSDIDFLIVTSSTLSAKTIAELETMHHQIWKSRLKWASKLVVSYAK